MPDYRLLLVLHAVVPELHDLLQVMLLSDGSVTRHLQLLTDLPVQVVSLCRMSHQSKAWRWFASGIHFTTVLPHMQWQSFLVASTHLVTSIWVCWHSRHAWEHKL